MLLIHHALFFPFQNEYFQGKIARAQVPCAIRRYVLIYLFLPGGPKKTEPKKNAIKRSKIKMIICQFVNLGADSVKFADYIVLLKTSI